MRKSIACTALTVLLTTSFPMNVQSATSYEMLSNDHEIVAKFEHGGKGYSAISKDCVGYSYGKWQISTKRTNTHKSTFDLFLSYLKQHSPKYYAELENAGGYHKAYVGAETFKNTWRKISQDKKFQKIYDEFILETQIKPAYRKLDGNKKLDVITTWGSHNSIVQAALHSVIIQHGIGGAYSMINNTVTIHKPKTPEEFIDALYGYRIAKYGQYKRRYKQERSELKIALNNMKKR